MERSAQVECEKLFLTEWLVNMAGINPVTAWIPSGIGNDSRRTYNSRLRSLFCMAQSVVVLRVRGSPPCCIVLSCQSYAITSNRVETERCKEGGFLSWEEVFDED